MSFSTFDIEPAEKRDWMGWPQVGWVRPTFPTYFDGVVQRMGIGERAYWRQDNAWTDPVAIGAEEYEAFRDRVAARVEAPSHQTQKDGK